MTNPQAPQPAHTPGPWRFNTILTASENDRGWNIVRDHPGFGGFVGTVSPRIKGDRGDASAEGLANARLIAAAPDLLAVLQEIVDADDEAVKALEELGCVDPECVKLTNKARAAIAKATGAQA